MRWFVCVTFALVLAACGDDPARLAPGETRTQSSRLWTKTMSVAPDGRLGCTVTREPNEYLIGGTVGVLRFRFEAEANPAPYKAAHRREVERCKADNAGDRPRAERDCVTGPDYEVRFDVKAGDGRMEPAFVGSGPIELMTMAGGTVIVLFIPRGPDTLSVEVRPVLTWLENRRKQEAPIEGAAFTRTLDDLVAGAVLAWECEDFIKGKAMVR
jgi:hypothetical protein